MCSDHNRQTSIKRGIRPLPLLLVCLLLSGCAARSEKPVTSVKIGIIVYDQYDNFISELMKVVIDEAAVIKDETGVTVNLEIQDAAGNQSTQNEQVRKLIKKDCDVVCVNLVDRTEPTVISDLGEKRSEEHTSEIQSRI